MRHAHVYKNMFDWDSLSQYDNIEIYGVCLTQREAMILKAALIPAYWVTRWMNFPGGDTAIDSLDSMIAKIDNQLDGNDCPVCNMEFRDNPLDPCEVQYSNDGETWKTMFRKDNCAALSMEDVADITNTKTDIVNNYTTYAGDIVNVAPDWEYNEEDTDLALCWAIDFYVDWICRVSIAELQKDNEIAQAIEVLWEDCAEQLSLGIVAGLALTSLPAAAGAAVAWAVVEIITEYLTWLLEVDISSFEDEDAKQAVKCWMWDSVRGETPQWADWSTSLDTFEPGDDAEGDIAGAVEIFNKDENVYINYMMLMNDVNEIATSLPPCDCPAETTIDQLVGETSTDYFGVRFCHSTSLAYSNPGDSQAVCPGFYNEGGDIYTGIASSIGGVGQNIRVTLPPNHLVKKVRVRWRAYRTSGASSGDKNAGLWLGEPNNGGTYIGGHSWGVAQDTWQEIITQVYDVDGIIATPESHLWIHNSIDRNAGLVQILWVHVECIAYDP